MKIVPVPCLCILAAILVVTGIAPAQDEPELLLPDLVPLAGTLKDHRIQRKKGRVLLRLSNTVANVGDGPAEVRGERQAKNGPMVASQVLYSRAGGTVTEPIGAFEFHREHRHWHLLQVAEYRLLTLEGELVAGGGKVSYCLADDHLQYPNLPNAPRRARYRSCSRNRKAKRIHSGISVGWGDTYFSNQYDQWIDVTGVPPGRYLLQSVANPDGVIREKRVDNNTATIPVDLP